MLKGAVLKNRQRAEAMGERTARCVYSQGISPKHGLHVGIGMGKGMATEAVASAFRSGSHEVMGKQQPVADDDIFTMPMAELKNRVTKALALLAQLDELLPGLIELPDDDRNHTNGRFRSGEAEALASIIEVADKKPALFESLADKDERFEPELLRDRLQRAIVLEPLVKAALEFASATGDTRLLLGERTRPVLLAMYEIVKPHAKRDHAIATMCKPVLDFFSALGRAAAATRRRNKQAPPAG
jgi:hypothetical protein